VRIGIVGHEAAKFTPETEQKAKNAIMDLLNGKTVHVVSGGCHLGGIDIWAVELAKVFGLPFTEHIPTSLNWSGSGGFKERNLRIAHDSDAVYCLVVKELPASYTGMRFKSCYHCHTDTHVKSGGCWTVRQARQLGKPGTVIEI
jgi:hypothetical protein